MSVPDTTTCPICYCIIDIAFMVRHVEYHQEAGDIGSPEPEYDPDLEDPFSDGNLIRADF
jgi:hypothetical protein